MAHEIRNHKREKSTSFNSEVKTYKLPDNELQALREKTGWTKKVLDKETYIDMKKRRFSDEYIAKDYGMNIPTLSKKKKGWGISGMTVKDFEAMEKANELKEEKKRYEEKQKAQQEEQSKVESEKLTETLPAAKELADKIAALQEEKNHLWKENKDLRIRTGKILFEKDALEERIEMLEKELAELEGNKRYKELYVSHAAALRAHLMDV
ncbi:hypothetical protein [Halalkalibacterium halodurans]|uniref:hypothetical protein n=1 Tax=Halalkalibacterium halodurans TaxID=86665 RepID=UPI002AA9BAB4|nr:hypothetical protein [Halalkalibacterium halodurans]MDY7222117.1 hypothetical protein [Halalkalibacterium halodurans]MDY7243925.1 hypothetical protein [Halalkalibacterium halodurans]